MKSFREFSKEYDEKKRKRDVKPQIITVQPSHGSHSRPKSKQYTMKFDESTLEEALGEYGNHHDNNHLGNNEDEVHERLNKPAHKFHNHEEERNSLRHYTEGSHRINSHLIRKAQGKDPLDHPEDIKEHEHHIKHLDNALHKSKLNHDLHVYHGLKGWHPGDEARKGNGLIHLPAYTSTSLSKHKADQFSDHHILHIHLKKGDKGKYLGTNSAYDEEKEHLLPRNTVLKVHPKFERHGNKTIWHATVHSQHKD